MADERRQNALRNKVRRLHQSRQLSQTLQMQNYEE
jgi:hypothetical protein